MRPDFWQDRWRTGQIGFHQAFVEHDLIRHWPALQLSPSDRVFVPLCGKSIDLLWIRDQGHPVVAAEISDIALVAFCMENGIPTRRYVGAYFNRYEAANLILLQGDCFALTPDLLGPVQAVYDRAALISWAPDLRKAYVDHLDSLTPPGTKTLLITLEYQQSEIAGPPFSVDRAEVQRLYAARHAIDELSRRDILADAPRMRTRGVSGLMEISYRLTRL